MCVSIRTCTWVLLEAKREYWIPWSYRWSGWEPDSGLRRRAADTLNCRALSTEGVYSCRADIIKEELMRQSSLCVQMFPLEVFSPEIQVESKPFSRNIL